MTTQEIPLVELEPEIANTPAPIARRWMVAALLAVLGLFAAGALSIKARAKEQTALSGETARLAVTTVSAAFPQPEPRSNELELPGSVQAYTESPIYARTNGYLLRWYKDIGANVQKGELLADLDTPEVDQELSQAQAARQQMVAALDLAMMTIGWAYSARNQPEKALASELAALTLAKAAGDPEIQGGIETTLMIGFRDQHRHEDAIFFGMDAVSAFQQIDRKSTR